MSSALLRAAALAGSGEVVSRTAVLSLSIVSARLLGPDTVGVLGAAVVFPLIISMLGGCVDVAGLVTERQRDDVGVAGNAMLLKLCITSFLGVALWFAAPTLGLGLVGAPAAGQFTQLARILAVYPAIEALAVLPVVASQRGMALGLPIRTQVLQSLSYAAAGLVALNLGLGTPGLAWAQILAVATAAAYAWFSVRLGQSSFAVSVHTQVALAREAVRQAAGGLPGFLSERIDNLLVVSVLGPASLAHYSIAWSASRIAPQLLTRMAQSSLLPLLAQTMGRDARQVPGILKGALRNLLVVSSLLGALVIGLAEPAVSFVFDPRWKPAADCLRLMGLFVFVAPALIVANFSLTVAGKFQRSGLAAIVVIGIQLVAIPPFGQALGAAGAAGVDVFALVVATGLTVHLALSSGFPHVREAIRMAGPWVLAGLGAGLAPQLVPIRTAPLPQLLISALVVFVAYGGLAVLLGGQRDLRAVFDRLRTTVAA